MKRFIAAMTAFILMMGLWAAPAFAEGSLPADSDIGYWSINGDAPQDATIPIYGYVGEDATITDPDPDGPGDPPTITPYEINVSVPVKIMWAAFESDAGAVSAPNYKITNNSEQNDVEVTLTSFLGTGTDNAAVDKDLALSLTGDLAKAVVTGNGTSASYFNTPDVIGVIDARDFWAFSLGGTYAGGFDTVYLPTYEMVLTFDLA